MARRVGYVDDACTLLKGKLLFLRLYDDLILTIVYRLAFEVPQRLGQDTH
jgi:hypothetical protein